MKKLKSLKKIIEENNINIDKYFEKENYEIKLKKFNLEISLKKMNIMDFLKEYDGDEIFYLLLNYEKTTVIDLLNIQQVIRDGKLSRNIYNFLKEIPDKYVNEARKEYIIRSSPNLYGSANYDY
jgi:uncharacterized protein with gpF-like domain